MTDAAWYRRYFGPDYLRIYRLADTARQREFLARELAPLAPARVLDLPCGHGRHAVPLRGLGLRVIGLDLSLPFLQVARRAAADQGLSLPLVRGDMRWFPFADQSFEAAICMFNSLGYFDDVADNQLVLDQFARVLRPGARFILDLANIEHVRIQPRASSWEKDGARVETEYRWHEATKRAETIRQVTFAEGRSEVYRSLVRLFEADEIEAMLARAGLTIERRQGAYEGGEIHPQRPCRIMICRREP